MKTAFKGYIRFFGKFGCIGIRRYKPLKQTNALTTKQDPEALARVNDIMHQVGQAANEQASPTKLHLVTEAYLRAWCDRNSPKGFETND